MDKEKRRKWTASGKEPVKIVRFTNGDMLSVGGTLEEIEEEMKERFPDREITDIT